MSASLKIGLEAGLMTGLLALSALSACSEPEPAQELARAVIGPEGGAITGGGITLTIPPGAVLVDTEFVLLSDSADLVEAADAGGDWAQAGGAVAIEPAQRLLLPASVRRTGSDALFVASGGRTTLYEGELAYLEYLGVVAGAASGEESSSPSLVLLEPELDVSPDAPGVVFIDNLHVELALEGTYRVDLVLSAWDFSGDNLALNGSGHCAFEIGHLEGGSLTTGCANGELTASIHATGDWVSFDILPLQLPALSTAVSVGVVAGDGELSHSLGYFAFGTGDCYQEVCDDHGICVSGAEPSCACDEGFASPPDDPLSCGCVPVCEGKECGPDACGGSCGGCGEGTACDAGACVPEGGTEDSGDTGETTGDGDTGETGGDTGETDGGMMDGTGDTDGGTDTTG